MTGRRDAKGPADNGAIRLRDAALELFGKHGYDGTSVRDIAERAGVTAGLVTHHYGTKENLRNEVDRYVLASINETWSELLELSDSPEIIDHMAIRLRGFQTLFQRRPNIGPYIRRVLMEQSPASNAFFDGLADVGNSLTDALRRAGLVRDTDDLAAQNVYALITGLMPVLLSRQIERHLDVSLRSDEGARRWAAIDYEAMTRGILVDPHER